MDIINKLMFGTCIYLIILTVFDLVLMALSTFKASENVIRVAKYLHYQMDRPFRFVCKYLVIAFSYVVRLLLFITNKILGN